MKLRFSKKKEESNVVGVQSLQKNDSESYRPLKVPVRFSFSCMEIRPNIANCIEIVVIRECLTVLIQAKALL